MRLAHLGLAATLAAAGCFDFDVTHHLDGGVPDGARPLDGAGVDGGGGDLSRPHFEAPPDAGAFFPATGGLEGGWIYAIVEDPGIPLDLYAATPGGVYKTTNGGAFWSPSSAGINPENVTSLAIDPHAPATLYACANLGSNAHLYRSTDSAQSWHSVLTAAAGVGPVAVSSAGVVAVATSVSDTAGALFVSSDGSNYNQVSGLPASTIVGALAFNGSTLFVASIGGALFTLGSGSTTLQPVTATGLPTGSFLRVTPIAFDSSDIYVGVSNGANGLYVSGNGGTSFSQVSPVLSVQNINTIIVAQSLGQLFVGSSNGLSHLGGTDTNWALRNNGLPTNGDFPQTFVLDLTTNTRLWAGMTYAGVFASTDSGASWSVARSGLNATIASSLAIDPRQPSIVWTSISQGMFRSSDGGLDWVNKTSGISGNVDSGAVTFDPTNSSNLWAIVTINGHTSSDVYRSLDGGDTWSVVATGATNPSGVLVDPHNSQIVYVLVANKLRRSSDGGGSWSDSGAGLTDQPFSLVFHPTDPTILYAGTTRSGVFKSVDGGATFASATAGAPTQVNRLAIDPSSPQQLYLSSFDTVYRTLDGGGSWAPANAGLPTSKGWNTIVVAPSNPRVLYTGNSDGLFRSDDSAGSWHQLGAGRPEVWGVNSIAVDPRSEDVVYFTGSGHGVVKTVTGGQ
jgi:hypothetical protein